ncbi:MAG: sulfatase-like hydrolase/transferase [Candidatus Bathyarchaeia archaeon]
MSSKPNIVFILCDSMDGRVMGCMDHPAMGRATPNLDRLADKGVLFRNAYANSPLCVPSRASIWSGMYVYRCKAWNNFKGLEEGVPTFEDRLRDAGYILKVIGKTDYLSGHHTERARVSAWTRTPNRILLRPTHTVEAPKIIPGRVERVHEGDWMKVDEAVGWLKDAASTDKPFMLYVGLSAPHPPYRTSEEYLRFIDVSGVEIPPTDRSIHPAIEYFRRVWVTRFNLSRDSIKLVRKTYFAMISEVDRMVGRILDCLEDLGLVDSTYIVFSSDHGDHAMEHGLTHKHTMYEPSVRVPLIISGPGVRSGVRVDDLISLVDLYPTFMDIASAGYPGGLDGYSLSPFLRGDKSNRPDWVFSEYHGESSATSIFMVRRGVWKYVAYAGMPPQLFDLEDDPWEVNDLASECKERVEEMDHLLRSIVDYMEVYREVEEYNRDSFRRWRVMHRGRGDYEKLMSRIFSGWEDEEGEMKPWTDRDEEVIVRWLEEM